MREQSHSLQGDYLELLKAAESKHIPKQWVCRWDVPVERVNRAVDQLHEQDSRYIYMDDNDPEFLVHHD